MNKKIYILATLIISLIVGATVSASWFADLFSKNQVSLGATTFPSSQVGQSPVNGYYLKTNGMISTWAAVSSTGGGGGGVGWASTTLDTLIYNTDGSDSNPYTVLIQNNGTTATTSTGKILQVIGKADIDYASTTQLTSTGSAYLATTGGNVGIGTTTPDSDLLIERASGTNNRLRLRTLGLNDRSLIEVTNAPAGYGSNYMNFAVYGDTFVGNSIDIPLASNAFLKASSTNMVIQNAAPLGNIIFSLDSGSTEKMRVTSAGNVGIGTTSPYAKLSVNGRGVFNQDIRADYFTATSTTATSTFPYLSATRIGVTGLASCDTIDTDADGYLKCGTDATGSGGGSIATSSALTAGLLLQSTAWNTIANIATSSLNINTDNLVTGATNKFMTYPGAGIALSSGSAWSASITDNSANWNTAYGWGDHAFGGYLSASLYYATSTHKNISSLPALSITKSQVSDFGTYENPLTFNYPLSRATNAISLSNMATSTITCTGTASCGAGSFVIGSPLTITGSASGGGWGLNISSDSATIGDIPYFDTTATSTAKATSTISIGTDSSVTIGVGTEVMRIVNGKLGVGTTTPDYLLTVYGSASTTSLYGNSLTNCTGKLLWADGKFSCGSDSTGTGGAGTVSTSTSPTIGQLAYWTSKDAWPETLGTVATTSLTATAPIALSQPISVIGGSASAITCASASGSAAGCLASADWTTFNNKISSTSLSSTLTGLTYTAATGVFSATAGYGMASDAEKTAWNNKWDLASSTIGVAYGGTGSTTLSGILKGAGTSQIATAVNGIDYTLTTAQPCTNQVITALTASGGSTCSSVSNAMLSNSTISGVALGSNLAALTNDATLSGSSYNGSGAISDWGLNLANPNIWTGLQTFANASSTQLTVTTGWLGTILGDINAGGATSLEIPNGVSNTFSAIGQIYFDTSDNQLLIGTSTANDPAVIPTIIKLFGGGVSSTSPDFINGGVLPTTPQIDGFSVAYISCQADGGTSAVINLSNTAGTTDSNTVTCDTNGQTDAVTANKIYTAGSFNRIEVGAITGAVDYLTYSVWGYITRE